MPRKKAIQLAKELGVALFKDGTGTIQADAPHGYLFTGSGCHYIICNGWADVLERMGYGIEKCDEPECETCEPQERKKTAKEFAEWMNWELIVDSDKF